MCGSNNLDTNTPEDIAQGIMHCGSSIKLQSIQYTVSILSILPRDRIHNERRRKICAVNNILKKECPKNYLHFVPINENIWIHNNGVLKMNLYHLDFIHLSRNGNELLLEIIEKCFKINKTLPKNIPSSTQNEEAIVPLCEKEFPYLSTTTQKKMYTCKQIKLKQSYKAAILKVPNQKYPAPLSKYPCITNFKISSPCHKNIVPESKSTTVPLSNIVKKSNFLNVNVVKSNKFKQVNHNLISHRRVKTPS